jgi:hypothetical protein
MARKFEALSENLDAFCRTDAVAEQDGALFSSNIVVYEQHSL